MDIKSKIFKRKSGKSKDKWIIRIQYFDEILGNSKVMERQAEKKSDAIDKRDRLIDEVRKSHGQSQKGERMTFDSLTDVCENTFYKPAVIVEGRKITGIRSVLNVKTHLRVLRKYFGKRLIKEITTESLTSYKIWRFGTISERTKKPVSITTVNRELSAMRKMMRFALSKGWILKDIFFNAKVIDMASEIERKRLLTKDEEIRLLQACEKERIITYKRKGKEIELKLEDNHEHLKIIVMLAIDSGLRRGEILKLKWCDIDFNNNFIFVVGTNTKTERERLVPLSERVKVELLNLKEASITDRPFPYTDIKHSFATAKKLAKIDDLHFHDLRRTAITRWIQQGNPLALAGKIAGHSQLQTTMKHYTNTDADIVRSFTDKINAFHSQAAVETKENDFVN